MILIMMIMRIMILTQFDNVNLNDYDDRKNCIYYNSYENFHEKTITIL